MRPILATVLLFACWFTGGRAVAQSELGLGALRMAAYPGYSFYALPVANAGLGRDWVNHRELQWQVGYNYSVIPVRIEFEHRMPNAFEGRIEIESPRGFYSEEAEGSFSAVYSQDILVPPSVPHTFMFAPRVCPQSQIMAPVEFTVRLYKAGSAKPSASQTVSAIQLEPGYLHSLWLDGLTDGQGNPAVMMDSINPGNKLGLQLPLGYGGLADILSSQHFIIAVDHRQVTGLPLAARDFAFVVADLTQVRSWPEEEQAALVSFVAGGGHLCVYHAGDGPWMGLAPGQPTPVGRGYFVPVQGEMIDARQAMLSWLEGELEEFVLWSGGSSSGWRAGDEIQSGLFGGSIGFLDDLAGRQASQEVISHRAGYLNPIWVYREACRSGSSEAWESALTLKLASSEGGQAIPGGIQGSQQSVRRVELSHLATPKRSFPGGLLGLLLACPFLVMFAGLLKQRRVFAVGLLCLVVLAGLYGTITAKAIPPGLASLVLVDADSRSGAGSVRYITATSAGANGAISTGLPKSPVVRHLSMDIPANWKVSQGRAGSSFETQSSSSRAVLSSDGAIDLSGGLPVEVGVTPLVGGGLTCTFDTSRLPPGAKCLVQLPSGWLVLHGGESDTRVSVQMPQITSIPGKGRLKAWSDYFQQISPRVEKKYIEVIRGTADCRKFITGSFDSTDLQQELESLGWSHLIQLPAGLRGAMQNQGVLYVEGSPAGFSTGLSGHEAVFWRITFPLGANQ